MDAIELRPARADDFEFLRRLHRECFKDYVEQTWGVWDEVDQLERLQPSRSWHNGSIFLLPGRAVGFLAVTDHGSFLFLDGIAILPEYQNRGLGTTLIAQVLERGEGRGIPVRLSVLQVNPAQTLYKRLRFFVVGGDEHRHFMERPPGPTSRQNLV